MKGKCKTCGRNCEGSHCFLHKPKKHLTIRTGFRNKPQEKREDGRPIASEMNLFFLSIWNKRKHYCENCKKWLGNEPLSYMFDHVLPKYKHEDLKFEKENIILVCLECHDNKERGFITDFIREKIKIISEKFGK